LSGPGGRLSGHVPHGGLSGRVRRGIIRAHFALRIIRVHSARMAPGASRADCRERVPRGLQGARPARGYQQLLPDIR
jgi:hypothetical protein